VNYLYDTNIFIDYLAEEPAVLPFFSESFLSQIDFKRVPELTLCNPFEGVKEGNIKKCVPSPTTTANI